MPLKNSAKHNRLFRVPKMEARDICTWMLACCCPVLLVVGDATTSKARTNYQIQETSRSDAIFAPSGDIRKRADSS
jgi:hypothetical protein